MTANRLPFQLTFLCHAKCCHSRVSIETDVHLIEADRFQLQFSRLDRCQTWRFGRKLSELVNQGVIIGIDAVERGSVGALQEM